MKTAFAEIEATYWAEGNQVRFYFNNPAVIVGADYKRKTGSDTLMRAGSSGQNCMSIEPKLRATVAKINDSLRYTKFWFDCKTGEVCFTSDPSYNPAAAVAAKWTPIILAEIAARNGEA